MKVHIVAINEGAGFQVALSTDSAEEATRFFRNPDRIGKWALFTQLEPDMVKTVRAADLKGVAAPMALPPELIEPAPTQKKK